MLSINKIKYIQSLHSKKFRQKYNNFIAEGEKIANEILIHAPLAIEGIFATAQWIEANTLLIRKQAHIVTEVSDADLKKISTLTTPNQVLMIVRQPQITIDKNILREKLVLYLDGIQDPGNMGTILRIADWFGIEYVLCSDTCVDIYNSKVIQATMGAFLRIKSIEIPLLEIITSETPVYGALLEGENIFAQTLTSYGIIVIGNEGKGIHPALLPHINRPILIPPYGTGAESLNAAVATGIICAVFRNKK